MKAVTMILVLMVAGPALADPQPQVKLTKSLICHSADSSPWYDKIKSPIATFKTVKDCLDSIEGAREPKRKKKKTKGGAK